MYDAIGSVANSVRMARQRLAPTSRSYGVPKSFCVQFALRNHYPSIFSPNTSGYTGLIIS